MHSRDLSQFLCNTLSGYLFPAAGSQVSLCFCEYVLLSWFSSRMPLETQILCLLEYCLLIVLRVRAKHGWPGYQNDNAYPNNYLPGDPETY